MRKTQIYFTDDDLRALHRAAASRHCSVASLVRDAVRHTHLPYPPRGPVAVWDGELRRACTDHDSIYDEHGCRPRG